MMPSEALEAEAAVRFRPDDLVIVSNPRGHLDGCQGIVRGGANAGRDYDVDLVADGGLFRIPAVDLRTAE